MTVQPQPYISEEAYLAFERASPTKHEYYGGMKFQHYRTIDTLREYILVAQDHYRVEHFARQDGGLWVLQEATDVSPTITIQSIECTLTLEDIYEKVDFEAGTSEITRELSPEERIPGANAPEG